MHESFLRDIAIVLGVAAITSAVVKNLKLPTVLGYMIAGLLIGPYIPLPLFADTARVETLSEFGVILVMFAVGLEFRLSRFFQVLPTAGITALLEISMMFTLGLSLGYLLGWSTTQAIFMGGALCISSTMIVSKVFEETRAEKNIREHVFGILVIQDIVAILLLAVLGTFAASSRFEIDQIVPSIVKLLSVLTISTIAGLFVIPKFVKYISKQGSYEVLTIVATGVCFAVALMVESMGYSVALGAFLAGILVSESGEGHKIEKLTRPLKDVFAAIFFVSVGMSVDPVVAFKYLPEALLISTLVILVQFMTVTVGGVLSGAGSKKAISSALALGQIGEFAFIIAAIGVSSGVLGVRFQAVIVTVSVLTSLTTPFLWKNSERIVGFVTERMPERLRILIGLYEAWLDSIKNSEQPETPETLFGAPKKIMVAMVLDALLLIVMPPMILRFLPPILEKLTAESLGKYNKYLVFALLAASIIPVLYGFLKSCSQFVNFLSVKVFGESEVNEKVHFRKLFDLTVWSLLLFLVSLSMLTSIRPFISPYVFLMALGGLLLVTFGQIWRQASEVTDEFQSGGERLVSILKKQTFSTSKDKTKKTTELPGLKNIKTIKMTNLEISGKTLSEINLRNVTGVTVVAINRNGERILFPTHDEKLLTHDLVEVLGTEEAKLKCKKILSLNKA